MTKVITPTVVFFLSRTITDPSFGFIPHSEGEISVRCISGICQFFCYHLEPPYCCQVDADDFCFRMVDQRNARYDFFNLGQFLEVFNNSKSDLARCS